MENIIALVEALPDVTFESPFPALEQFAGEDINFSFETRDINLPFGRDAFDITVTDSHNETVTVEDVLDVNAGNGVVADAPAGGSAE